MKQVNVDINAIPFEACSCGCFFWRERVVIKRISRLLTGEFADRSQNIMFMACENCNRPHPQTKLDFKVEKINVFSSDTAGQPLSPKQEEVSEQPLEESQSEAKVVRLDSSRSAQDQDNQ